MSSIRHFLDYTADDRGMSLGTGWHESLSAAKCIRARIILRFGLWVISIEVCDIPRCPSCGVCVSQFVHFEGMCLNVGGLVFTANARVWSLGAELALEILLLLLFALRRGVS